MNNSRKRIGYIDIMKAIGIICVIMGHYCAPSVMGCIIWSFHMPLFVMISGYFLKGAIDLPRVKKMVVSYLLPYSLVWGSNVILLTIQNIHRNSFSFNWLKQYFISYFWALGSNATLYKPEYVIKVGVIWFLMALFWGEFIMHVLLWISDKTIVHIICICALWLAAYVVSNRMCVPFGITNGISFLPWLYIGYFIKKHKNKWQSLLKFTKWVSLICGVIWIVVLYLQYTRGWTFSIAEYQIKKFCLGMIGALAAVMVVRTLAIQIDKTRMTTLFQKIGQATIWILCVHGIGIEVVSPMMYNVTSQYGMVCMLIRLILDVVIALGMKKIWSYLKGNIQNAKCIKKSGKISY